MDAESFLSNLFLSPVLNDIIFGQVSVGAIFLLVSIFLLLLMSALISGSEVATFALSPFELQVLHEQDTAINSRLLDMLHRPDRLLATILITNNFVNVAIIIISSMLFKYTSQDPTTLALIDFSQSPQWLGWLFQVGVVTFLLLLFGEIIPKIIANQYSLRFARLMTYPLSVLERLFKPISYMLINSTRIVNRRLSKRSQNLSVDTLSEALMLTAQDLDTEKDMLESIVRFGNIDAKEIMRARVDVVAAEEKIGYHELLHLITESGYSRIPIYAETFDNIKGVLYTKDLLAHLDKADDFDWKGLVQTAYFVPESKKLKDLLEEFQKKKIHLAIVFDEYGGTSGIVTLEDILEEIIGEITDENDDQEASYYQIDEKNYIFEGKTQMQDFYKIFDLDEEMFEEVRGDADSLAGFILELRKEIPRQGETFDYGPFIFRIEAADSRRIKSIKVTLKS